MIYDSSLLSEHSAFLVSELAAATILLTVTDETGVELIYLFPL